MEGTQSKFNAETIKALNEYKEMKTNKDKYKRYNNKEGLYQALNI